MRKLIAVLTSLLIISFGNAHADASLAGNWTCNYEKTDSDGSVVKSTMKMNLNTDHTYTKEILMSFTSAVIASSHKSFSKGQWSAADGVLNLQGETTKIEHVSGMDMTGMMKKGDQKDSMKKEYQLDGATLTLGSGSDPMKCSR